MTLADLKAKYPEIYEAVLNEDKSQSTTSEALTAARNEGRNEGIKAERERMKAIDDLVIPGLETVTKEVTNKAKYETFITAEQCAMEIIKAQKEKGINYLTALQSDASKVDGIPFAPAPSGDISDEEEDAVLAETAKTVKNITRTL